MMFRAMTADDLDVVLEVEEALHPFPWTRGIFSDSLAAGHGMWIASEQGDMVAYAATTQVLDEVHLLNITVLAGQQRAGRGARVMQYLFESCKAQGGARMFLEVRPSNQAAHHLYKRCGFIEIGRRKAYYPAHDGREDAIVMARDL